MKTAIKRKKYEFLVIPLKYVNRPGTPKLWAIDHENSHKTRKKRVLGHAHKNVLGFMFLVDHPGTPKLLGIGHENDYKTQNRRLVGHTSQICKSPTNPKTLDNS